ncbi:MAG: Glutamate--cysteine ligase [bacterium]|nr:Glutamate--cysteine ligase [bacterium]
MSETPRLRLFEGCGVELELMIVDSESLDVLPIADRLLLDGSGLVVNEIERDGACWSNELVLHVMELKTNGPVSNLIGVEDLFHREVQSIHSRLSPLGACLLSTAMHPWMDPLTETRLWPHGNREIYEAYSRIFGCRGHGWSNLQSIHLNLPFQGDEEFGRLHAAIRLALPILPALAASSPILEGKPTGLLDTRLAVYRDNQKRIPSITGKVIPEAVYSRQEYEERILAPMYREIAPHDPDGILQEEWLNSRGAIARFERETIEIRLLDSQECPASDLAVARLVSALVRGLVEERWLPHKTQRAWQVEPLEKILLDTIRDGDQAVIADPRYLEALGCSGRSELRAGELWGRVAERVLPEELATPTGALAVIMDGGCLSRRILAHLGERPSPDRLRAVYRSLADCLRENRPYSSPLQGGG